MGLYIIGADGGGGEEKLSIHQTGLMVTLMVVGMSVVDSMVVIAMLNGHTDSAPMMMMGHHGQQQHQNDGDDEQRENRFFLHQLFFDDKITNLYCENQEFYLMLQYESTYCQHK